MKAVIYLVKNDLLTGATIPQETVCANGECSVVYPYMETSSEMYPYMLLQRVRQGNDAQVSFNIDTHVNVVKGILEEMLPAYKQEGEPVPVVLTDFKKAHKFIDALIDVGTEYCSMLTTYPDYPNCWDKLIDYLIDNDMVPQDIYEFKYTIVVDFKD